MRIKILVEMVSIIGPTYDAPMTICRDFHMVRLVNDIRPCVTTAHVMLIARAIEYVIYSIGLV